jgi:hypothetical protein
VQASAELAGLIGNSSRIRERPFNSFLFVFNALCLGLALAGLIAVSVNGASAKDQFA